MADSVIYAVYEDPEQLKDGARKLVSNGVKVKDVFSPFPVHGIDPIIGVTRTRLAIASFMFGLTGLALAILGITYFMIWDWPMNICLLYTSDAADARSSVDLGGRRFIKKKKKHHVRALGAAETLPFKQTLTD